MRPEPFRHRVATARAVTPQLEELIKKKVESGPYNSASEVVREALRLLEEQERIRELKLDELRREVRLGVEQLHAVVETEPFRDSIGAVPQTLRCVHHPLVLGEGEKGEHRLAGSGAEQPFRNQQRGKCKIQPGRPKSILHTIRSQLSGKTNQPAE